MPNTRPTHASDLETLIAPPVHPPAHPPVHQTLAASDEPLVRPGAHAHPTEHQMRSRSRLDKLAAAPVKFDESGYWADGDPVDRDEFKRMMVLWIEDVLNGLICEGVTPEEIHVDQVQIGGYYLPIVRVNGHSRYIFCPYMEKSSAVETGAAKPDVKP